MLGLCQCTVIMLFKVCICVLFYVEYIENKKNYIYLGYYCYSLDLIQ